MRVVALAGLLVGSLVAALPAAANDSDRFLATAKKLIQAINSDDSTAIQNSFDAGMRQFLPPDKATPFFREVVAANGKLKSAGVSEVSGASAIVRVVAEHGAWDFNMTLDAANKISGLAVTAPAPETTTVARSRTSMQLPFQGEWFVLWGGPNETVNSHASVLGQRRAADLLIREGSGRSYRGTGRRNEDYLIYDTPVLAAASGTVVTAIDGVPDNKPGSMNPLCVVGNCLIIDQGSREFAVYAHLKPGSLRVHPGDKVSRGQELARCGNSGNSSEPHLHFHLQDNAILQDGAGITPYFTDVKCRRGNATRTDAEYTFLQGDRIQSATKK